MLDVEIVFWDYLWEGRVRKFYPFTKSTFSCLKLEYNFCQEKETKIHLGYKMENKLSSNIVVVKYATQSNASGGKI